VQIDTSRPRAAVMASTTTAGDRPVDVGGAGNDDGVGVGRLLQAVRGADGDQSGVDLAGAGADPYIVGWLAVGQASAVEDLDRHGQVEGDHAVMGEDGDTMHAPIVARFRRYPSRQPLFGRADRP
jgi:hypothetical protein